jgi:hypothetical protein
MISYYHFFRPKLFVGNHCQRVRSFVTVACCIVIGIYSLELYGIWIKKIYDVSKAILFSIFLYIQLKSDLLLGLVVRTIFIREVQQINP